LEAQHLHIVTHDVPWPADFGGLTDLFWKLKALQQAGVKIHLHCFTHGRAAQPVLLQYCASVDYYKRERNISGFSFRLPFIVSSRKSSLLIENLKQDDYPVLLEGIHCTWPLFAGELAGRKVLVRLHNVEYAYYHQLAQNEKNIFKRWYFSRESRLLKRYEKELAPLATFLSVSETDKALYQALNASATVHFLPVFLPWTLAAGKETKGCFCLYHGNLSVNENEKAVEWLLEAFNQSPLNIIFAGKSPSPHLKKIVEANPQCCLVADPTDAELQDMIAKAQVHLLPAFNVTGVKLKLLNAFFNGKHCLVNKAAVAGSGLENYCTLAETPAAFKQEALRLFEIAFTEAEQQQRQGLLQSLYNNERNAQRLLTYLQ
jgi:hypothetical protein